MEREQLFRWDEIEPLCLIRLLLHKLWLIVLAGLIGVMCITMLLNLTRQETHTSSVTFAVDAKNSGVSIYVNTTAAANTAAIYSELLQGRIGRELVANYVDAWDYTITAQQLDETNLLRISVTSPNPRDSLLILQAIIEHHRDISHYVSNSAVLTVLNSPTLTSSSHSLNLHKLQLHSR